MSGAIESRANTFRWRMEYVAYAALYIAMVGTILYSLRRAREYAVRDFSSATAQEDWTRWRDDVQQGSQNIGPVSRRTPRSVEPPTLVLLRDHYAVCVGGALVMSSVLFLACLFFLRAIFSVPAPRTAGTVESSAPGG